MELSLLGLAHVSVRCPAVEGAGDDTRHALMCGIMAAEYRAMSVSAVDRSITNRHLVIQGDAGYGYVDADKTKQWGRGRRRDLCREDEVIFFLFWVGDYILYRYSIVYMCKNKYII